MSLTETTEQTISVAGRKGKTVADICIGTETYKGEPVETKVSVSSFQILESDVNDFLEEQQELIKRYCA